MCLLHLASFYASSQNVASMPLPNKVACGPSGCKCGPSGCKCGPSDSMCALQAELRQLQPVLERTAVDVEAMMLRITADKKEAAATQKAVAQQEQEANEQAARVSGKLLLPMQTALIMPDLHMRNISVVLCTGIVTSEWWYITCIIDLPCNVHGTVTLCDAMAFHCQAVP
jgi:hypothetical protein